MLISKIGPTSICLSSNKKINLLYFISQLSKMNFLNSKSTFYILKSLPVKISSTIVTILLFKISSKLGSMYKIKMDLQLSISQDFMETYK